METGSRNLSTSVSSQVLQTVQITPHKHKILLERCVLWGSKGNILANVQPSFQCASEQLSRTQEHIPAELNSEGGLLKALSEGCRLFYPAGFAETWGTMKLPVRLHWPCLHCRIISPCLNELSFWTASLRGSRTWDISQPIHTSLQEDSKNMMEREWHQSHLFDIANKKATLMQVGKNSTPLKKL